VGGPPAGAPRPRTRPPGRDRRGRPGRDRRPRRARGAGGQERRAAPGRRRRERRRVTAARPREAGGGVRRDPRRIVRVFREAASRLTVLADGCPAPQGATALGGSLTYVAGSAPWR